MKKNKNVSWFLTEKGQNAWQYFAIKVVEYVDIEKHVGLSPAALCAASLWGAAISVVTPGKFPTGYYLNVALILFGLSVIWNAAFAAKSSEEPPARRFAKGMADFFGLLVVASARQPFSFLLAGLPYAIHSPVRYWVWAVFIILVAVNLARHWRMKRRPPADDVPDWPGDTRTS